MSGPLLSEYLPQRGMMSFAPIKQIHQHLVGLHPYSTDRSRVVPSHHFCSCAPKHEKGTVRQCIIYDSDKADARLIGIEYVVDEDVFNSLDKDEQKYWHSHKYEVESGMLCLRSKELVPTMMEDQAEQGAMKELHKTYGKTIHTWAVDSSPSLPLGPPSLMMSFTEDAQVHPAVFASLKSAQGIDVEHKRELRAKYLDLSYQKHPGSDQWEKEGKAIQLIPEAKEIEQPGKGGAVWKGNAGNLEAKGRGTISISSSKEETGNSNLHVHYCICGEFILVVDAPLAALPRRPTDKSFALLNQGASKRTYKLNVTESNKTLVKPNAETLPVGGDDVLNGGGVGAAGKEGNGVLALRDGKFEYQRRFYCTRCQLQIGYETLPGEGKGVATFILPGALTDTQNKVPADAFGEPAIMPSGDPKGVEV
ncbi:hypothetical protein JCM16303_001721 [Sporobolomyces ruberrimus]